MNTRLRVTRVGGHSTKPQLSVDASKNTWITALPTWSSLVLWAPILTYVWKLVFHATQPAVEIDAKHASAWAKSITNAPMLIDQVKGK